ncbi:MAG: hypothetical protein IJG84_16830 [Kiritimatiellae bacterium]|nr:hypothetical protein [Kiritimatiellia bacterium]
MNTNVPVMHFAFSLLLMASWPSAEEVLLLKARTHGALAKECLHVVDQDGLPVAAASVWGGLQTGDGYTDFIPIRGTTNTNGDFVIQGKCTNRIRCDITKDGYYDSEFLSENYGYRHSLRDGKWHPYGSVRTVVMKKIANPCKLHAFPLSMSGYQIPKFDEWLGFDFERNEWTFPYGKGRCADVLLRFSAMKKGLHDYRYAMDVSFTNNPYAGGYQMKVDKSSELTTTYIADSNAVYRTEFSYVKEQSPGAKRHWDILDSDSYIVFRTRTRIDEHGKLVGAHYGKLLGQWFSGKEYMTMSDGCFNPVENDVNIEDGGALRNTLRNRNRKHGRNEVPPCANLK